MKGNSCRECRKAQHGSYTVRRQDINAGAPLKASVCALPGHTVRIIP